MTILLTAILIWFLYMFITRFVIPVYITSRRMKQQFDHIRQQRDAMFNQTAQQNGQQTQAQPNSPQSKKEKEPVGEYIEFEEVK